jgi:hypothetical protein
MHPRCCPGFRVPPLGCLPARRPQLRLSKTPPFLRHPHDSGEVSDFQTHPPALPGNSMVCFILCERARVFAHFCGSLHFVLTFDTVQITAAKKKKSRETIFLIPVLCPNRFMHYRYACSKFRNSVPTFSFPSFLRNLHMRGRAHSFLLDVFSDPQQAFPFWWPVWSVAAFNKLVWWLRNFKSKVCDVWLHCISVRKMSMPVPAQSQVMSLLLFIFSLITLWFVTVIPKYLKFCHIFKRSIGYIYVTNVSCILVTSHQHTLNFLCLVLDRPPY